MADDRPVMSATFLPGTGDDYNFDMPASVSHVTTPSPQRPHELADSVRQMSLNAEKSSNAPPPPAVDAGSTASDYIDISRFPTLPDRTPNVPQTDIERGQTLENARVPVLNSSDPEVQLIWASDTLTYVDIHLDNARLRKDGNLNELDMLNRLQTDAVNIVNFLADQQHPRALFMRALWLEFGKYGQIENKAESFRTYKKAAERGFSAAEYRMGLQFESTKDLVKALQHYRAGEALGDPSSCYRTGMIALRGQLGQPLDLQRGTQLIRHSADYADSTAPQGAYIFGMLLCGDLPEFKVDEAILPLNVLLGRQYLERAAFLGFSRAQTVLGTAYELGSLGCELNPALSVHYHALAAVQGDPKSQMALSKWYLVGSEPTIPRDEAFAYKFVKLASKSDSADALFAMGYFNEIGLSIPPDKERAITWYQRAAAKGHAEATARLNGISRSGTLSKKDHESVALNRIRSTHGSMRGRRPIRPPKVSSHMPSISDTPIQPPIQNYRQSSAQHTGPSAVSHVNSSRPPYPADGPPLGQPAYMNQPVSSAAYPPYSRPNDSPHRISQTTQPIRKSQPTPPITMPTQYPPRPPKENLTGNLPQATDSRPGSSSALGPSATQTMGAPMRQPRRDGTPTGFPPSAGPDSSKYARGRSPANSSGTSTPSLARQRSPAAGPSSSPAPGTRMSQPSNTPVAATRPAAAPTSGASNLSQSQTPAQTKPPPRRGPQTFEEMGIPASKPDSDCAVM